MYHKYFGFICLISLFFTFQLVQAHSVSGLILDAELSIPIEGVRIYMPDQQIGAISNELGQFELNNLKEGSYLIQISSLGYERLEKEIEVTSSTAVLRFLLQPKPIDISEVVIAESQADYSLKKIRALDLELRPINSSQDVLRSVPGLFIGQHAGGGKAEQIFLRGFDIDHGTDIHLTVDGLPVNMVSHAHGQGYSDLHFLIPETIGKVDFGKGPYQTHIGNFATAGHVGFQTKTALPGHMVKLEGGMFNSYRIVGMANLIPQSTQHHAYLATEYQLADGFFESSQNFRRGNIFAKYSGQLSPRHHLSVSASNFQSQWDASGQIPERAILSGMITRFGAIDDTEGGSTSRTNLNVQLTSAQSHGALFRQQAYVSQYQFELFSNFTFFLEDPENGDQIRQKEDRRIYGYRAAYERPAVWKKIGMLTTIGTDIRIDEIKGNELSHTKNRTEVLDYLALGEVNEINAALYLDHKLQFNNGIVLEAGLRLDHFDFQYQDALTPAYDPQRAAKPSLNPKLRISYQLAPGFQLYSYSATGFHSNDARVILSNTSRDILPRAYGSDLGAIWKPTKGMILQAALWGLWLDQEFVYVGDAGIVEPSGKTRRLGGDLSLRYQLSPKLFIDLDVNYSHARATEEAESDAFIPLAPSLTSIGGISYQDPKGFQASLRYRHLSDRPANEDYSLTADGYTLLDATVQWNFPSMQIGVRAENLLNEEWKEAQFETESRLREEAEPVAEIHFTPGTPFSARLFVAFHFR